MVTENVMGVGIIGTGGRGNGLGKKIVRQYPQNALMVTAVHDKLPQRMNAACREIRDLYAEAGVSQKPAVHQEAKALIEDANVDLILITTHTCDHAKVAIPAIQSGKKVYCDKPLAHTVSDALAIRRAAYEADNPILVGFTRRYEATWRRAFEIVQEGAIGDVVMLEIREMIPFWHYFQTWHRRRKWSGGGLMDKCSHHADVFNWFSGARANLVHGFGGVAVFHSEPNAPLACTECQRECQWRTLKSVRSRDELAVADIPEAVRAEHKDDAEALEHFRLDTCVFQPGADDVDHAAVHWKFDNAVIASLQYAIFCPRPGDKQSKDSETLEVVGTAGRLRLIREEGRIELLGNDGKHQDTIDLSGNPDFTKGHCGADPELAREMARFTFGAAPIVSADQGYKATRMVAAAQQSIAAEGTTFNVHDMG